LEIDINSHMYTNWCEIMLTKRLYTANAAQMTPQTERGILQENERKRVKTIKCKLRPISCTPSNAARVFLTFLFVAHHIITKFLSSNRDGALAVKLERRRLDDTAGYWQLSAEAGKEGVDIASTLATFVDAPDNE